jgi:hypothetical protein
MRFHIYIYIYVYIYICKYLSGYYYYLLKVFYIHRTEFKMIIEIKSEILVKTIYDDL